MKKTVSLIIAISMLLSVFAAAATAEPAFDSAAFQAVLSKVKNRVEIPKELDEFSFDVSDSREGRSWYFHWSSDEAGSLNVTADDAGRILSYYRYKNDYYTVTAPELTKAEAFEAAKKHLGKIAPEVSKSLDYETFDCQSYNSSYRFIFYRAENGLPCNYYSASIMIRYDTGELVEYNLNWDFDIKFPKIANPISEQDAVNTWKNTLEMELRYNLVMNTVGSENPKAFLAYSPKAALNAIDAETGKEITETFEWIQRISETEDELKLDAGAGKQDNGGNNALTEAEIKKAAQLNELITLAAADKKIRALPHLALDSGYKIARSYLYLRQNYYTRPVSNDKFIWEIMYSGPVTKGNLNPSTVYTQIDAKTGELVSYSAYSNNEDNKDKKRAVNKEQAKAIADKLAAAAVPEKYKNTRYTETSGETVMPLENTKEEPTSYSFTYTRTHEGIPCASNYINVEVNAITGKVSYYNFNWTDNVEFESPDGLIGEEASGEAYISSGKTVMGYNIITSYLYDNEAAASDAAMSATISAVKTPIYYPDVVDREYRAVLTYNFVPVSGMISAKTGKPTDSAGKEIDESDKLSGYSDIETDRSNREIALLRDAGILPADKEFKPGEIVKQKDFLAFLIRALDNWYQPLDTQIDLDNLYRTAESLKITEKSERDPDKELTRYETMKYMVRALGYGKLSGNASLFNVTFSDAKSIPRAYYGIVALAKHFALTSPAVSSFNGAEKVTRSEAAAQIYRFMKAVKNK